jgi:hypothetical protein
VGQISMSTRDELVVALAGRYASSNRQERGRILDEFVAVSGLHRKHAMRLLRSSQSPPLRAAAPAAPGRDGKAGLPIEQESGSCAPAEIDKLMRPREHSGEAMPGSLGSIPG